MSALSSNPGSVTPAAVSRAQHTASESKLAVLLADFQKGMHQLLTEEQQHPHMHTVPEYTGDSDEEEYPEYGSVAEENFPPPPPPIRVQQGRSKRFRGQDPMFSTDDNPEEPAAPVTPPPTGETVFNAPAPRTPVGFNAYSTPGFPPLLAEFAERVAGEAQVSADVLVRAAEGTTAFFTDEWMPYMKPMLSAAFLFVLSEIHNLPGRFRSWDRAQLIKNRDTAPRLARWVAARIMLSQQTSMRTWGQRNTGLRLSHMVANAVAFFSQQ